MKNRLATSLCSLLLLSQLTGCGGGSSSTIDPPEPPSQVSPIPTTAAKAAIAQPQPGSIPAPPASVSDAVLRHVHRNTVEGILKPDGNYIDSPNGKVERLTGIGLYADVDRQADNTYKIEPKANGLSYFKVTNTKPNGSVRVHNFHGVPPGHYMTFDTTDVADDDNYDSKCRSVSIRLNSLPQQPSATARLVVNGNLRSNAVYHQGQGYVQDVNLCPIDQDDNYLAFVTFEQQAQTVEYGFNFYQDLQDGDLLEVDVEHQALARSWSAEHQIGERYSLYGRNPHWNVQIGLYASMEVSGANGFYPHFAELNLDTYLMTSQKTVDSGGVSYFDREFSADLTQVHFPNNAIALDNLSLGPLRLTWDDVGVNKPKVVTGILFDVGLTQTYAFMSMDPEIINGGRLNFPLDDVQLVADSALAGITGSADIGDTGMQFVGNAAIHTGFLYWPNGTTQINSDLFITADINEFLQILLEVRYPN